MKNPLGEDLEHLLLLRLAGRPSLAARLAARALRACARRVIVTAASALYPDTFTHRGPRT
jgi:hypothetical protein